MVYQLAGHGDRKAAFLGTDRAILPRSVPRSVAITPIPDPSSPPERDHLTPHATRAQRQPIHLTGEMT